MACNIIKILFVFHCSSASRQSSHIKHKKIHFNRWYMALHTEKEIRIFSINNEAREHKKAVKNQNMIAERIDVVVSTNTMQLHSLSVNQNRTTYNKEKLFLFNLTIILYSSLKYSINWNLFTREILEQVFKLCDKSSCVYSLKNTGSKFIIYLFVSHVHFYSIFNLQNNRQNNQQCSPNELKKTANK